ncbi:hypothetical protein [Sporosarcina sp. Te-1]|uniref:hypothetical protein n=1 Tax=Sporosarcina sp. Te-1 TaxID=2818390 RepID=UPI001A9F2EF3|nr:hypothetical protein [Sporosarcina sp. Te-1]QTD40312.1 hypothetical protein J3U78_16180 [Sporosarcina sp. Te-1]
MKYLFRFVCVISLSLFLVGCTEKADTFTFTGKIERITGTTALVLVEEGDIQGSEVEVNLSVNTEDTFLVGDRIEVGYDGSVMESAPLQIKTLSVQFAEE